MALETLQYYGTPFRSRSRQTDPDQFRPGQDSLRGCNGSLVAVVNALVVQTGPLVEVVTGEQMLNPDAVRCEADVSHPAQMQPTPARVFFLLACR